MGEADERSEARSGHGWWPYAVPYFAFLLAVELANRMPDSLGLVMLVVKAGLPLGLIAGFAARGAYPELRGFASRAAGLPLDLAFGAFTAVLWMAPFIAIPALRPAADVGFDPAFAGEQLVPLALSLRILGYSVTTPLFEELFIRSFVMRVAEVWGSARDFRDVPIAQYGLRSFLATIVIFTIGHVPWEWWVAIPWVALTNVWFYWRGHLLAVVAVHASANATIALAALYLDGFFGDGSGGPLSLWFFI